MYAQKPFQRLGSAPVFLLKLTTYTLFSLPLRSKQLLSFCSIYRKTVLICTVRIATASPKARLFPFPLSRTVRSRLLRPLLPFLRSEKPRRSPCTWLLVQISIVLCFFFVVAVLLLKFFVECSCFQLPPTCLRDRRRRAQAVFFVFVFFVFGFRFLCFSALRFYSWLLRWWTKDSLYLFNENNR